MPGSLRRPYSKEHPNSNIAAAVANETIALGHLSGGASGFPCSFQALAFATSRSALVIPQ